jgi:serine/threonine protein kinase
MGVSMSISQNNKIFLSYKLPFHFLNNNENIGNKLEDFEILQIMGRGAYGFVAKVKSKINLKIYALKKNIVENMNEIRKLKLKNELLFLKKFDHQNVCKCLTTFEENNCNFIVMKLFNNKDLFQFLEANRKLKVRIKEDTLWDIFRQCLEGLLYIHNEGVIHRDIKPGNIFMDDTGNIQIGDFGVSAVMDQNQISKFTHNPEQAKFLLFDNKVEGTENYQAPEVRTLNYDQKADVYSMGVSFFVLCYYKFPFCTKKFMMEKRVGNKIENIVEEKLEIRVQEMVNDNYYSYELRNIIYKMIQREPRMRPTSSDINFEFKKYYIKLYSKNSGLYSLIQCLFSFPNFSDYFTDENQMAFILETEYPKKISLLMISLIASLRDKKDIAENIYALRQILFEE